jgi:MYXO-CTERM domain-containing protein
MFQFDGGTFDQTLARDGVEILLEEGNIAHAVEFVLARIVEEIPAATDSQSAAQWMNSIPIEPGHPLFERWGELTSCRYNGCCASSCGSQRAKYKDAAIDLYYEFGPEFWNVEAEPCGTIDPAGGVIDDDDRCAFAGGNPEYWRNVSSGYGGSMKWTHTTDYDDAANYAVWTLNFKESGLYLVEAYIERGENSQSQLATYVVSHATGTTDVVLDQSAGADWEELGEFDFNSGGSHQVRLDDNTGEPNEGNTRLAFDAIRVNRVDDGFIPGPVPPSDTDDVDVSGGCAVGGPETPAPLALLLFGLVAGLRRLQRRLR